MTAKLLRLAPGLALPQKFATEGVIVLGVRGSGKSNTEVRWAEVLYDVGIPWVAVDPKGDWWGIQSSADRKSPGMSVPILGGLYGNGPLTADMGAQIADLLVDKNMSAVLDVSRLSKTIERPRFLVPFFNRLMERHQLEPHVRCVILEEAHSYIPQQVPNAMAALKEAAASVLLEGRAFGLGCWACSQRPARINNDVLEEVDTAIIHRIGVAATADLKRVRAWVKHEDLSAEISESLTKLANGQAWVLSPTSLNLVTRVQIDRRTTFDSGAAPLVGAGARRPVTTLAQIDMDAINAALAESIAKAEADNPAELKKHNRALQRRVDELETKLTRLADTPPPTVEHVEISVVPDIVPAVLQTIAKSLATFESDVAGALELVDELRRESDAEPRTGRAPDRKEATGDRTDARPAHPRPPAMPPASPGHRAPGTGDAVALKAGAWRMVDALARYGKLTRDDLSVVAHVAKGGTLSEYARSLVAGGYALEHNGVMELTDAGVASITDPTVFGDRFTVTRLRTMYAGNFKAGALRMFDLLIAEHPDGISRADLSTRAQVAVGGTLSEYSRSLLKRGVAVERGGLMYASDVLFLA